MSTSRDVLARLKSRTTVTVVVLGVLAGLVAWQGLAYKADRDRESDRREVIALAEQQVLDLTTLDSETVTSKLAAMEKRTTGDFKTQLSTMTQTFESVVAEQTIKAEGEIVASAVSEQYDDDAVVMVVVSTTVTSKAEKEPTARSYRMSVSVSRRGGDWLISNMEFVA